ncbi:MAG: hypothetical protein ACHQT8_05940 [Chlamydiales bacterium]
METSSPLDNLPGSQKIERAGPLGEDIHRGMPAQPFSSYMEEAKSATLGGPGRSSLASPFQIAAGQTTLPATPTLETLSGQVVNAQSTLGDVNTYLTNPNLKLKQSSKYLLKNKLSDANTHIRTATSRLGVDQPEEKEISVGAGPITRFVNYVTNGQNLLEASKQKLAEMKEKGEDLKPADFLLIQVQLNLAQQSLEYSSVVLSKAMDDIKMLMQTQL